ncbi:MAG: GIN domain-containing protein [Janthinobacterium lividum]
MNAKITVLAVSAAVMGFASVASAQTVHIEDAAARVIYRPEDRSDFDVAITGDGAANLPRLRIERSGSDLRINGGLSGNRNARINRCRNANAYTPPASPGQGASANLPGVGALNMEDAPLIVISGPRNARIRTSGAVHGTVARGAENVDIGFGGCGSWVLANTEDRVRVAIGGSGNVWTGRARRMDVNIGGSGRVKAGHVEQLDVAIGGSGNIDVRRASGPVKVTVSGSGNVKIEDGNIPTMDARIMGSGNIEAGGSVGDLNARIMGAGNIRVARVTGNISRTVVGVGRITVND